MTTKYKILIISVMVLSILTCFAITSFATYTTTDITYNNITYTYNIRIVSDYIIISNYDKVYIARSGNIPELEYLDVINSSNYESIKLRFSYDDDSRVTSLYITTPNDTTTIETYAILGGEYVNILITGQYQIQNSNNTIVSNIADINEYDIYQNEGSNDRNIQVNLINYNQTNPLEKVDDFLTYLSTSLNKLTTMILANQILILFIVAVPVVSFVIGSFKRIKDSGRV